jgi:hypothetical protein
MDTNETSKSPTESSAPPQRNMSLTIHFFPNLSSACMKESTIAKAATKLQRERFFLGTEQMFG